MHMADALISPLVGGTMLAAAAGLTTYSANRIKLEQNDQKIPLMGVMGAFVFATQMINFSIPGTGSSGHLGGGLLLAILLGPAAGFLAMASVLIIQALFFADGGLLALGCNLVNLGFLTCYVAYPLIYKPLAKGRLNSRRITLAAVLAAVVGLQLGAFSVVLQTLLSGKTELPFTLFLLLMQPIHLAIGLIEGLVTAAIVTFVYKTRPDILGQSIAQPGKPMLTRKQLLAVLLLLTVLIGGFLSWFASANPDGLEWSIERAAGTAELEADSRWHRGLAFLQEKTALMPDYALPAGGERLGTTMSGFVGGSLTLCLIVALGVLIRLIRNKKNNNVL